jgi:nitrogen fixation protein NifU and related proteins
MSNELGQLYQDVIIDHSRHPHNFGRLADATRTVEGINPLCGDQITLYVKLLDDRIDDIAFEGVGCAISVASASLMTTALKGKQCEDALALFGSVHYMLTESPGPEIPTAELGKLAALSGVSGFPMRVKCATLVWHALHSALEGEEAMVSSE